MDGSSFSAPREGRKEGRMETRCTLWGCIAVLKVGLKSIEELLSESNIYENSFKIGPGQWTQCSGHHISSALCSYKYNYIYSLFVSSDWSSYSDDVLLYIYTSKPTFSDYHSVPCCKWCYKCHSKSLKQYQCKMSQDADWMLNVKIFQCSNVPIFQCSSVSIFQCSNIPSVPWSIGPLVHWFIGPLVH